MRRQVRSGYYGDTADDNRRATAGCPGTATGDDYATGHGRDDAPSGGGHAAWGRAGNASR